jgi:cytochrome c biogenesis protein CcdA
MSSLFQGEFAYSLLLGMLAAVNPCGFVLLPTYLTAYLAAGDDTDAKSRVARSLVVGSSVSLGFVGVFVVVGTISRLFTGWIEENAKYPALIIGIGLIALGARMLSGWRPRFWVPSFVGGSRRGSIFNMVVFGVVYAIASIGCTIGLLTTAILGSFSRHGVISGIISVALYGLGMGLFVTALTVSLAFAKGALLRGGRSVMRVVNLISSGLVLLSGIYLTWYWYVAITQSSEQGYLLDVVGRWQSELAERVTAVGSLPLFVGFVVVIAFALALKRRQLKSVARSDT